jgi:hypothetical protein
LKTAVIDAASFVDQHLGDENFFMVMMTTTMNSAGAETKG